MRRLHRFLAVVDAVALGSFLLAVAAVLAVLVASAHAPPPAEPRPVDYDDDPTTVAADAVHNLGAAEYAYEVRVRDTGDRRRPDDRYGTGFETVGDRTVTTVVKRVRIDNPARRYRGRVTFPAAFENEPVWVEYYAEGPEGHRFAPQTYGDGPVLGGSLGYAPFRNAFQRGALAAANATVVAENRSVYVVRVTDTDAAMATAYPGTPGPFGTTTPGTVNATANLTLTLDRATGHVAGAVLRYHHHRTGRHIVTTFDFDGYGQTRVARPVRAGPPGPMTLLYRLDLGLWALATLDWPRVGGLLAALVVAGLLVDRSWGGRGW